VTQRFACFSNPNFANQYLCHRPVKISLPISAQRFHVNYSADRVHQLEKSEDDFVFFSGEVLKKSMFQSQQRIFRDISPASTRDSSPSASPARRKQKELNVMSSPREHHERIGMSFLFDENDLQSKNSSGEARDEEEFPVVSRRSTDRIVASNVLLLEKCFALITRYNLPLTDFLNQRISEESAYMFKDDAGNIELCPFCGDISYPPGFIGQIDMQGHAGVILPDGQLPGNVVGGVLCLCAVYSLTNFF